MAEALATAPERVGAVLADPEPAARWRTELGLAEPSTRLGQAIDSMAKHVRTANAAGGQPAIDAVLLTISDGQDGKKGLDGLARRVLSYALEQRISRRARQGAL